MTGWVDADHSTERKVVRPDQYVGHMLPLAAHGELGGFLVLG